MGLKRLAGVCLVLCGLLQAQGDSSSEPLLLHSVRPVYPKLAIAARIQGTVRLAAVIDRDGNIQRLKLVSGHPLLVEAAMAAVIEWRYRPAVERGVPVAVFKTIDVPFRIRE